jgi:uncharacterized protein YkwD
MLRFLLLLIFITPLKNIGQNNSPVIKEGNVQLLEHLVKVKIDSMRLSKGLQPLYNDSILYLAAKFHSEYCDRNNDLSHYQKEERFNEPSDRARHFGANENYYVGENLVYVSLYGTVYENGEKSNNYYSLNKVAHDLAISWYKSRPHYKNIIRPEYNKTGLAIVINEKQNRVYATQLFAYVQYDYNFKVNKEMFPHSSLPDQEELSDFEELPSNYDTKTFHRIKEMEWFDKEFRDALDALNSSRAQLYLYVKNGAVYLEAKYNAKDLVKVIEKNSDGFAVELVTYEPYHCGNPDYYQSESRRSGKSLFNDTLLPPVYKKDIQNKFRPRRKSYWKRVKLYKKDNEEAGFLERLVGAYNLPYEPTSINIRLGRLPKEITSPAELNLVILKDNKLLKVSHFSGICSEYFSEFYPIPYLKSFNEIEYEPNPNIQSYSFDFFFPQGKSTYRYSDIKPLLDSISKSAFVILDASIVAHSSPEGSTSKNEELQNLRAKNLIKALQEGQSQNINFDIETPNALQDFKGLIDTTKTLDSLKGLSDKKLLKLLENEAFVETHETYFKKLRFAHIKIRTKYDLNDKTLGDYLIREYRRIYTRLNEDSITSEYHKGIDTLLAIQKYTYQKVKEEILSKNVLTWFETGKQNTHVLYNNFYCFQEEFNLEEQIKGSDLEGYLDKGSFDIGALNYINFILKTWEANQAPSGFTVDEFKEKIDRFYFREDSLRPYLKKVAVNYSFKTAEYYFQKEEYGKMLESISFLYRYYSTNDSINQTTKLRVAKVFSRYHASSLSQELIRPYIDNKTAIKETLIYFAKLIHENPIEAGNENYVEFLMEIRDRLSQTEWCSMFTDDECSISFQVLDSEMFRDFYCSECLNNVNLTNTRKNTED